MTRIRSMWSVIAACAVCFGTVAGAQVVVRSPVQRDAPGPQANERRIPVGTSTISGTVMSADTEWPVPGAQVTVSGQARCVGVSAEVPSETMWLNRTVITDAAGQFSFPRLPPGAFRISVSSLQNQFLVTNYGQRRPGGAGQFIQLADGQKVTLKVPVLRGAVIAGTVRGSDGEPLRDVQVRALGRETSSGARRWQAAHYAQTDDRGAYRLYGLMPGDYIVAASPNPREPYQVHAGSEADLVERAIVSAPVVPPRAAGMLATIAVSTAKRSHEDTTSFYLPTYAPSATSMSDATTITVAGSEERTGVDILVHLIPAGTIKGVVATPLDAGVTVHLTLLREDQTIERFDGNMARMSPDGTFTFRAVAPGNYTVFAQTMALPPQTTFVNGQPVPQPPPVLTAAQKMWGKTPVTVSGEATVSATVQLQESKSISGVIVFDTRVRPDLIRTRLTVHATATSAPELIHSHSARYQAVLEADGRFTITGVPAGRYRLGLDGWPLKSAVVSGQDTLDFPIEFTGDRDVTDAVLTVSDQPGALNGTLTDSTGRPALDYVIIVAAADSRFWGPQSRRVRMARLDVDGRYAVTPLPPGLYQISVVNEPELAALSDPDFLRTIARTSIAVTITDGGTLTQDLRVK